MKQSVDPKTRAFYSHLANIASEKLCIPSKRIKVIGNSKDYPDSIAVSMNDLCSFSTDGFVLVRYGSDGKTMGQYALTSPQLMEVYKKFIADGNRVQCESHSRMSRSEYLDGNADLTRVTWNYLDNYII